MYYKINNIFSCVVKTKLIFNLDDSVQHSNYCVIKIQDIHLMRVIQQESTYMNQIYFKQRETKQYKHSILI